MRHQTILLTLLIAATTGCSAFTRTIYIHDGTPVRLRATIRGAMVWIKDADGQVTPGRMDLPEGWYALPLPPEPPEPPE
jgi:hypothetical protein